MKIDPVRLKELREAKGLSRAKLAKLSRVSPKQIQRLESLNEAIMAPRDSTVDRLAKALQVKPEILSGDEPLPESEPPWFAPSVRSTQRLGFGVRLAYDLVERRYGVKSSAIMDAAPLFFVLLAEGSLDWRRNELAALKKKLEDAWRVAEHSNRHRGARYAGIASDHLGHEDEAIKRRDLMNDPYPFDYDHEANDDKTRNPFAEYLQQLTEELNVPGIEVDQGFVWGHPGDGIPRYSVCRDELERIDSGDTPTGGLARVALQAGDVRISDIPDRLEPDSAAKDRKEWLEAKASRKTGQWLQNLQELLVRTQKAIADIENEDALSNGEETAVNHGMGVNP